MGVCVSTVDKILFRAGQRGRDSTTSASPPGTGYYNPADEEGAKRIGCEVEVRDISPDLVEEGEETQTAPGNKHNELSDEPPHRSKGEPKASTITLDDFQYPATISILGVGGFGLVTSVIKQNGPDSGNTYAMKSMSKSALLKRTSGLSSVTTELQCMMVLNSSRFVCKLYYAFQDEERLHMVLELGDHGDMRKMLRSAMPDVQPPALSHFDETTARFYIAQVLLALQHCHALNILHRGK